MTSQRCRGARLYDGREQGDNDAGMLTHTSWARDIFCVGCACCAVDPRTWLGYSNHNSYLSNMIVHIGRKMNTNITTTI